MLERGERVEGPVSRFDAGILSILLSSSALANQHVKMRLCQKVSQLATRRRKRSRSTIDRETNVARLVQLALRIFNSRFTSGSVAPQKRLDFLFLLSSFSRACLSV